MSETLPPLSYSDSQLLLARRIACDAYESTKGRDEFNAKVLKDIRLDNCTPEEVESVSVLAGECFEYWDAQGIEKPTAVVEDLGKQPVPVVNAKTEGVDVVVSVSTPLVEPQAEVVEPVAPVASVLVSTPVE